jgi:hypothetical protein
LGFASLGVNFIRSLNIVWCSHSSFQIVLMAMYAHRSFWFFLVCLINSVNHEK